MIECWKRFYFFFVVPMDLFSGHGYGWMDMVNLLLYRQKIQCLLHNLSPVIVHLV